METKRIVLVDGSHLLSEMLQRIFNRKEDLEVVDILSDCASLPEVIDRKQLDWVIFSRQTEGILPEEIDALLNGHLNLHVLTIMMDTGNIKIDWIGRHNKYLKITTVEGLVETLRRESETQFNSSPR
jgi:DNA-binding NarL/FixJ family response regulator